MSIAFLPTIDTAWFTGRCKRADASGCSVCQEIVYSACLRQCFIWKHFCVFASELICRHHSSLLPERLQRRHTSQPGTVPLPRVTRVSYADRLWFSVEHSSPTFTQTKEEEKLCGVVFKGLNLLFFVTRRDTTLSSSKVDHCLFASLGINISDTLVRYT